MPCDYRKYPSDWPQIRTAIRKRSGNRCELCHAQNGLPHPITKSIVVLTIAHMDDAVDDQGRYIWNDPKDLLDLCQRCHNKIDLPKRRHRRRGL
jgi:hypothetical protein